MKTIDINRLFEICRHVQAQRRQASFHGITFVNRLRSLLTPAHSFAPAVPPAAFPLPGHQ